MATASLVLALGACMVSAEAATPLAVTITSGPSNPSNAVSPTFTFSASAANATYTCALDTAAPAPCTSPTTVSVSSGPHVLTVVAHATTGQSPPAKWTWSALGAGAGDLSPWALQVENPRSNFAGVAPHQALLDAAHFNFIIAHPIAYQGQVAAMKRVNPRLTLLAYLSGTFAQYNQGTAFPSSWYLYDSKGNKVTNLTDGNYLMNPTVSGWIQNRVATCQTFLAQSRYDGCYLDTLGLAALSSTFVSAAPVNPATGQLWTQSQWIAATAHLAASAQTAIAPVRIIANGLSNGPFFYSPTSPTKQLVDGTDGGLAEAWIRGSAVSIAHFPPETVWLQNVTMIGATEQEGKPLLATLKVWATASQAQLDQWQQYSVATFLLGTGGLSALMWSPGQTVDRSTDYPIFHVALGAASGSFAKKAGGVFERAFMDGLVVVNPTLKPVTVPLPSVFYDINGKPVSQPTLSPNSGAVLTTHPLPIATITAHPPASTSSTSASVSFSTATAGTTFACSLDGAAPAACTSPFAVSNLSEGAHLLSVEAVTSAGVVGPQAVAAWTVDINPPTTKIVSAPPSSTTSTSATVTFTASKVASTFTCSLDGAAASPCTPGPSLSPTLSSTCCGWTMTYGNLPLGTHHLSIFATDPYGLVGPTVTVNWTIT